MHPKLATLPYSLTPLFEQERCAPDSFVQLHSVQTLCFAVTLRTEEEERKGKGFRN